MYRELCPLSCKISHDKGKDNSDNFQIVRCSTSVRTPFERLLFAVASVETSALHR